MTNPILVPGLSNPAQNGFNMKELDFLGSPIFELSYLKGNKVSYGPSGNKETYDLPDNISMSTNTTSYSQSSVTFLKTKSDYDNSLKVNLTGEYSSPTFSGSMTSNLAFHGQLFQQKDTTYSLNWDLQQTYSVERDITNIQLTAEFKSAIGLLTADSQKEDFIAFFEKFGTHFLVKGGFGGYMTMQTSIEDSLFESNTEKEISTGITAGYDGIVASGQISASVAVSSSTFLSENKGSTSVYVAVNGGQKKATLEEYFETTFDLPILLLTNPGMPFYSNSISNLVELAGGSQDLKVKMESQIEDYIDSAVIEDGLIGSAQNRNNEEIYSTANDGFLLTCIQAVQNGNRGFTESYSSSSSTPTLQQGSASIHYYTDNDTWVPWSSSTVPIKAADYYRANNANTSGIAKEKTSFIPMSLFTLQQAQSIALNQDNTPTTDGFVFCTINATKNGDRGYAEIQQDGISSGASIHYYEQSDTWVPKNSFCFPVVKNKTYAVSAEATSGAPSFEAFFMPIQGDVEFAQPIAQIAGTVAQAKSDGFLVAYLDAKNNGDRSQLAVYANQDRNLLLNTDARMATSIHYYTGNDTWVPKNSVFVPIEKGEYYVCNIDNTSGTANHSINFVPYVAITN